MAGRYFNDFGGKSDVVREFSHWQACSPLDLDYAYILLASYVYENYSGEAFVLYKDVRDNKLYEVNGSHCSCYGLEDQWEPECTDTASLRHRVLEGYLGKPYYGTPFATELLEVLDEIDAESNAEEDNE